MLPRPPAGPFAFAHDQQFDHIVGGLHEAALDDAAWPRAAALIDAAGAMHSNHLFVVDQQPSGALEYVFGSWHSHGAPLTALEREYGDIHFRADERVPRLLRMPAGSLVHTADLGTDDNDAAATPPAVAEQAGADQLMTHLDGLDGLHVVWVATRLASQGVWRRTHIDTLRRLLPHLRAAVRVRQALAKAEARSAALRMLVDAAPATASLLIDRQGRVVESSERERGLLAEGRMLTIRDGVPSAAPSEASAELARLLAAALPGRGRQPVPGEMSLADSDPRRPPKLPAGGRVRVTPVPVPRRDFGARRVVALLTLETHLLPVPHRESTGSCTPADEPRPSPTTLRAR